MSVLRGEYVGGYVYLGGIPGAMGIPEGGCYVRRWVPRALPGHEIRDTHPPYRQTSVKISPSAPKTRIINSPDNHAKTKTEL